MGVASLVLGIVSLVIGFIPLCGSIALIPAIVGLILGIVDIVQKGKKKEPRGMSIAGTTCSAIAIIIIIYYVFILAAGTAGITGTLGNEINNAVSNITTY